MTDKMPVYAVHPNDWDSTQQPIGHATTERGANRVLRRFYRSVNWGGYTYNESADAIPITRDDRECWCDQTRDHTH